MYMINQLGNSDNRKFQALSQGVSISKRDCDLNTILATRPLVSVILPTHNRAYTIGYALLSLLRQTYANWEVIIVCDACTDNTLPYIQSFRDSRIRILTFNKRLGSPKARNLGIISSRGQILLMLEDDAYIEEHCLEEVVKAIRMGADLVAFKMIDVKDLEKKQRYDPQDWYYLWKRELSRINPDSTPFRWHKWFGIFSEHASPGKMVEVEVCRGVFAIKKNVLNKIGGYDEGYLGNAYQEETDLQLRARKAGFRIVYVPSTFFFHLGFKNRTGGQSSRFYKYELFTLKNHLRFLRKFYSPGRSVIMMLLFILHRYGYEKPSQFLNLFYRRLTAALIS
jgi:glycosyltransferase involved in cell wall biosynthesis